MSELEDRLNAVLSNPEEMSRIAAMAQKLMGELPSESAAADVLRILCIFTVAWFHIWQQSWLDPSFRIAGHYFDLQRIVRRGYMLVDLTLMLTGFLLYRPLVRAGGRIADVKGFYYRRLCRILPCYLLAVLVAAAFALARGRAVGSAPLWRDLLTHLTFTHTPSGSRQRSCAILISASPAAFCRQRTANAPKSARSASGKNTHRRGASARFSRRCAASMPRA